MTVTEQTAATITLVGTDADGTAPSVYKIISLPTSGILSDNGTVIASGDLPKTTTAANVVYTSNSDTATSDSFTFKVNDGTDDSTAATVSLAITGVNDVPVATAQTDVAATEQTAVTITLAGTDADGTGSITKDGAKVVYVPQSGFFGLDSFTFKVNDGTDDSTAATVSLAITGVNDVPVATAQTDVAATEQTAVTITLAGTDADGTGSITKDGAKVVYVPQSGFFGLDSFTFKVNDGTDDSTAATVSLAITGVNDVPVATAQTDVAATEQTAVTITLAGTDADGTGSITKDGAKVVYVPQSGFFGLDSFTFKVNDGTDDSTAATVSLAITGVNDVPVATAQTDVAATEQTAVTITLAGTDADGTTPSIYIIEALPTSGTLSDNDTIITDEDLPLTTSSADVVYISTSDSATSDSFTFKVNDGTEDSTAAAKSITITGVNDVPVATAQTDVAATEQTAVTITLAGTDADGTAPSVYKIISSSN